MKNIEREKIQTWFVTGASSGVGREMCKQLSENSYNVIAVSRRVPQIKHENVLCLSADVTDTKTIKDAIQKGIEHFGSIDVLANNAGISSYLSVEEEPEEEMRKVMETNFWGTYNTCHELLPFFRKQGYGTIINMSSECGLVPRCFGAAYCSSKYAVEGLSSVLWWETQKFCRVMAVELSYFENTEIGKDKPHGTNFEEYKDIPATHTKFCRWHYYNDLSVAVQYILKEVQKKKMQRRLMLGRDIICKVKTEIKFLKDDLNNSLFKAYNCGKIKPELPKKIISKIFKK